jgi:regulator of protease activity HflC (stomatin/prohibitin superfamily)
MSNLTVVLLVIGSLLVLVGLALSVRIVKQYERGVVFRLPERHARPGRIGYPGAVPHRE